MIYVSTLVAFLSFKNVVHHTSTISFHVCIIVEIVTFTIVVHVHSSTCWFNILSITFAISIPMSKINKKLIHEKNNQKKNFGMCEKRVFFVMSLLCIHSSFNITDHEFFLCSIFIDNHFLEYLHNSYPFLHFPYDL